MIKPSNLPPFFLVSWFKEKYLFQVVVINYDVFWGWSKFGEHCVISLGYQTIQGK